MRRIVRLAIAVLVGVVLGSVFAAHNALVIWDRPVAERPLADELARAAGASWETARVTAADGAVLEAWAFTPRASNGAGVIVLHGVGDSRLGMVTHARFLLRAGYTVLTFDSRGFGASDAAAGRPRWHYDPNEIVQDYCNAVSYALTRPDVDPDRVGVVGVCMGGGYAVSVAARDKRVKAVASVAGGYDIGGTFQQFLGVDGFAAYYRTINDLVQREYETGDVQYVPTIAHALSA